MSIRKVGVELGILTEYVVRRNWYFYCIVSPLAKSLPRANIAWLVRILLAASSVLYEHEGFPRKWCLPAPPHLHTSALGLPYLLNSVRPVYSSSKNKSANYKTSFTRWTLLLYIPDKLDASEISHNSPNVDVHASLVSCYRVPDIAISN